MRFRKLTTSAASSSVGCALPPSDGVDCVEKDPLSSLPETKADLIYVLLASRNSADISKSVRGQSPQSNPELVTRLRQVEIAPSHGGSCVDGMALNDVERVTRRKTLETAKKSKALERRWWFSCN